VALTFAFAVLALQGCKSGPVTEATGKPAKRTEHQGKGEMEKPAMKPGAMPTRKIELAQLVEMAPARGYLMAHRKVQNPKKLIGGPRNVSIEQNTGNAFVALPDKRKLDSRVFGIPELPRAYAGTPAINGVPPEMREIEEGRYTHMKAMTPFGDKHAVMGEGKLTARIRDVTATDGATTEDTVNLTASWKDKEGNTYTVKCCDMMAANGVEYPTFGGVVTNHMLHGFTRIGTGLMPSLFAYAAFWGMGTVSKNGKMMEKRLIHGMLTEYVRKDGYKLAMDHEVKPTVLHFHLMVPPFMPDRKKNRFQQKAVNTGFKLPNGKQLPFWHVMFENLDIKGTQG
jgi:hypothetical protein